MLNTAILQACREDAQRLLRAVQEMTTGADADQLNDLLEAQNALALASLALRRLSCLR